MFFPLHIIIGGQVERSLHGTSAEIAAVMGWDQVLAGY